MGRREKDGRAFRRRPVHSLGHGESAGTGVLELEVLVFELLAVDGLAAGAVAAGEVTSLDHEVCVTKMKIGKEG